MKTSRLHFALAGIACFSFVLISFQNCTPVQMSSEPAPAINKSMGNGGPYGGLFKIYRHYNSVQPCASQDLKGRALPNTEILFKPNENGITAPYLGRENCQDLLAPSLIADQDLQITDSTLRTLTYKNTVMTSETVAGEFEVAAAACPTGKSPIPSASRTNLFLNSLDWTQLQISPTRFDSPGWYTYRGIGVGLYSTIQSLPAFMVHRNQSSDLDFFNRHSQHVILKPNTEYAFSFVGQAGSVAAADVMIYRGLNATPGPSDETALVQCHFQSISTNIQYAVNVAGISSTITPFGNGYLCTIYFRSSATANQSSTNIGVTPSAFGQSYGQQGDSVIGTAAQLVEVNQFCR